MILTGSPLTSVLLVSVEKGGGRVVDRSDRLNGLDWSTAGGSALPPILSLPPRGNVKSSGDVVIVMVTGALEPHGLDSGIKKYDDASVELRVWGH